MEEVDVGIEEGVEETCWLWVSFLLTFTLASFAYRIFGPESPNTATNKSKEINNQETDNNIIHV